MSNTEKKDGATEGAAGGAPKVQNGLPNARELAMLRKRFGVSDLSHPCMATLFNYVMELLPREGDNTPYHRWSKLTTSEEVIPLDPISLVQMEVRLPPLPAVLGELQEVANKPFASSSTVAAVVVKDISLTAWLLKLVNSPFFGFSIKVDTVTRAVTLLGIEQFKTLAMGSMVNSLMEKLPDGIIDGEEFWRHSIATALAAQSIWKTLKKDESERLFVAGLLHDCGVLALAYAAPKTFSAVNQAILTDPRPRHVLEQELLEFDHARLGGMLLHRWNMPLPLVMSVLRHHQVEAPQRYLEASVIHLADIIAFAIAGRREDEIIPALDPLVWDTLKLTPANLNFIADATLKKLGDMCGMLRKR